MASQRSLATSSDDRGSSSGGDAGDDAVCWWMRVIGAAETPVLCFVVPALLLATVVTAAVSISFAQKDTSWMQILLPAEIAFACIAVICVSLITTRLYFPSLYARLGGAIVTLCCKPWLSAAVPASMGGIIITMLLVALSVCLLNVKLADAVFLPWSVVVLPLIFVIAQMFLSPPCSFPGSGERGRDLPPLPFVMISSPLREIALSHSQISLAYLMPILLSLLMLSARLMGSFSFDAHFIMSPLYVSLIVLLTRCVRIVGSRPASRFPPLHLAGAIALITASAMLFLLLLLIGEYDRTGASALPLATLLPVAVLLAPFIVYAVARTVQQVLGSPSAPECLQQIADAIEQPGTLSRNHVVIPIAASSALALRDSPRADSPWHRRSPRAAHIHPALPPSPSALANSASAAASSLAASHRFSPRRGGGGDRVSRDRPRFAASTIEDAHSPFARPRGLSVSPRRAAPRFLSSAAASSSSLSHAALLAPPPLYSEPIVSPSRSPRASPRRAHAMAASAASSESAPPSPLSPLSPARESRWAVSRRSSPRLVSAAPSLSASGAAGAPSAVAAPSPRSSFATIVPQ